MELLARLPRLLALLLLLCGPWMELRALHVPGGNAALEIHTEPPRKKVSSNLPPSCITLPNPGIIGGCARVCCRNETRMLDRLPGCGKVFAEVMRKMDIRKWCHKSDFIVYYESFFNCTAVENHVMGCFWPNPMAQSFINRIHRQYFSNCTVNRPRLQDPPDEILIPLIAVPVMLTVAMTGLVVWRTRSAAVQKK